ncbi:NAD(P)/FAD-dependent oxidoreductase [Sphingosinicella sp. YJ22]|uniref:flavin-containing monooxygenase n=1 Tax=Sphingosinicella sp. YJ22 TaxID=1104780 RepID=UPI002434F1DA|nr:NAD(P)/FAD-dependent oxidoreductase [Sphingosinicella sp. YJ22]
MSDPQHFDVIIVGAGLSGIGMAHHLQRLCPWARYAILEARQAIGGTWDLFRYPGIRSDSDMHTLGYSFRPWRDPDAIAGGDKIRRYIEDTAAEAGIDRHISFGVKVARAAWSSEQARWRVEATDGSARTCRFLVMCAGYYSYDEGHRPTWPGEDSFDGAIVHPQFWPDDLDWRGKRIAVIGSGATAVTLIPALAEQAAHVTMVQRSPSFVMARPSRDGIARALQAVLPARTAAGLVRWKNVLLQQFFFRLSRRRPAKVKAKLLALTGQQVGADQLHHFTPRYNPWEQRLCLAPDGDLFAALRAGSASVVTGEIERFTPDGLRLADGSEVAADIIVTATGLKVQLAGAAALSVDGQPVRLGDAMAYKGLFFSDLPNFASIFGYTNASWTLKADLSAAFICRVLNRMRRRGETVVAPRRDPSVPERPFIDFSSTYLRRAAAELPKQGERGPWRLRQSYAADLMNLRFGRVADGVLTFR